MGFSKAWDKKGLKPKKAWELKKNPVDVQGELDKLAAKPDKPAADFGIGGKL